MPPRNRSLFKWAKAWSFLQKHTRERKRLDCCKDNPSSRTRRESEESSQRWFPERGFFCFLDLPEEVAQTVAGYLTAREATRLAATSKTTRTLLGFRVAPLSSSALPPPPTPFAHNWGPLLVARIYLPPLDEGLHSWCLRVEWDLAPANPFVGHEDGRTVLEVFVTTSHSVTGPARHRDWFHSGILVAHGKDEAPHPRRRRTAARRSPRVLCLFLPNPSRARRAGARMLGSPVSYHVWYKVSDWYQQHQSGPIAVGDFSSFRLLQTGGPRLEELVP